MVDFSQMNKTTSRKGILLIATCYMVFATAKLGTISEPGGGSIDQPDYVLAILTKRQLLSLGVAIEFLAALVCYSSRNLAVSWASIASLSGALLCYRIALATVAGLAPCSCIGVFGKLLGISQRSESIGTLCFLVFCFSISWQKLVCRLMSTPQLAPWRGQR